MAESSTVNLLMKSVCRPASWWNITEKDIARIEELKLFFSWTSVIFVLHVLYSIGHLIFSITEWISSSLAQVCSTGYTKTDYSKRRRILFLLTLPTSYLWEGLNHVILYIATWIPCGFRQLLHTDYRRVQHRCADNLHSRLRKVKFSMTCTVRIILCYWSILCHDDLYVGILRSALGPEVCSLCDACD